MTYKSLSSAMGFLQKTNDPDRVNRRGDNFRQDTLIVRIDDDWSLPEMEQAIADLQRTMLALDEEIGSIKTQLGNAKARRHTEKVWADPEWFARASAALRHKGRQRQSYQTTLSEMNRRARALRAKLSDWDDGRMFINVARSLLPEQTYRLIWDEVNRRRTT